MIERIIWDVDEGVDVAVDVDLGADEDVTSTIDVNCRACVGGGIYVNNDVDVAIIMKVLVRFSLLAVDMARILKFLFNWRPLQINSKLWTIFVLIVVEDNRHRNLQSNCIVLSFFWEEKEIMERISVVGLDPIKD
jgi:hypothetical protein